MRAGCAASWKVLSQVGRKSGRILCSPNVRHLSRTVPLNSTATSFHLPSFSVLSSFQRRALCTDKLVNGTESPVNKNKGASRGVDFSDVPGVKSEGDKYAMVYTCSVCETRAAKMISKQAYHHGTVLIRCPGCQNLHLIADHLGQFEERGWNVEDFLAEHGEKVTRVAHDNVLELTMKDITGEKE